MGTSGLPFEPLKLMFLQLAPVVLLMTSVKLAVELRGGIDESVAVALKEYWPTETVEAKVPVIMPSRERVNPLGRLEPEARLQL